MNYFIDFPTLSSLYGTNTENDDEKPPPELKTKEKEELGLRKTEERGNRKATVDYSMSRKEKSSWPDWQFWKRSDGPFGSFRNKTTKTSPANNCSRKEMSENKYKKHDVITNEPCSSNGIVKNDVLSYAAVTKTVSDDPLVSYKNESNGSKHVVLNMNKVESLAGSKDSKKTLTDEKYLKTIARKPCDQQSTTVKSKSALNQDLKNKLVKAIDEKPRGKASVVDNRSCNVANKIRQEVEMIKKLQQQQQQQQQKQQQRQQSVKVEQGKLHNVLKKDHDGMKAPAMMSMNGAGHQAQIKSQNITMHGTTQPSSGNRKLPAAVVPAAAQKIGGGQMVLQSGISRGHVIQPQQQHQQNVVCGLKMVKANEGNSSEQHRHHKAIMKDAATNTMKPVVCVKIDASTQVSDEQEDDDTVECSVMEKRPHDTERVLKMQVLLDDKEVVINKLKEAGRKQRDCFKTCKKRCKELEEIIGQASMADKPELIRQINELTDIKNDLIGEITSLTVDIERERSVVKLMKNELIDVKAQLEALKKKNTNSAMT